MKTRRIRRDEWLHRMRPACRPHFAVDALDELGGNRRDDVELLVPPRRLRRRVRPAGP